MDVASRIGKEIATGNAECIAMLKKWLAEARKGHMCYFAMATFINPDKVFFDSVGAIGVQAQICNALEEMRQKLDRSVSSRFLPHDPEMPANQVTLNLSGSTICYDVVGWLIGAEMARIRAQAPAPLKVCLYRPIEKNVALPEYQKIMLENVVIPAVLAVGGEINKVTGGRSDFCMLHKDIVEHCKAGEKVPRLRAAPLAKQAIAKILDDLAPPIVITLRETQSQLHRNSSLKSWIRFARDMTARGELVVFVRDTEKATEEIPGFATFPIASIDLHARIALYERAKINMFVANGPAVLNWHLDAPFLMFSELDPKHTSSYEPAWPEWWPDHHGIEAGAQFPWFNERQKIIWQRDTYETISAAYEATGL
jgi:hypothetical protein